MFASIDGHDAEAAVRVALPHLKYLDGVRRGYVSRRPHAEADEGAVVLLA